MHRHPWPAKMNCVKIHDFIFEMIDFSYFYFNIIKNHNNSDYLNIKYIYMSIEILTEG